MKFLPRVDPEIYDLIKREEKRQAQTLMMIPSENTTSHAVMEAVGTVLMNKYAEGYPHRRYYQGQTVVDELEMLTIERAKKIFGVAAVNVQPHSGSPANFAVYTALLNPGDTLMGLSLASGGHLTHGAKMNASSKYFHAVAFENEPSGYLDYDKIMKLAKQAKPKIIIAGFTAYPRLVDWEKFAKIADAVGAYLMTDISHISGLVAACVYPSPVPYAHVVTTTTHKTLRGPRGAMIMTTQRGLDKDPDLPKKINSAIIPGSQGGPHLHSIAGIAVALKEAGTARYKQYAKHIIKNAKALASALVKYDFTLISGGTDSHLILMDIRNKDLLGNTAALGCEMAGIILNRNGFPGDTNPPFYPAGLRLGTPGITSRGMKEPEMKLIAGYINAVHEALRATKLKLKVDTEAEKKKEVRAEIMAKTPQLKHINRQVKQLCQRFPIIKEY